MLVLLLALMQADPAPPVFRAEAVDAHIDAVVTERGRPVAGLTARDFSVSRGGRDLRVTGVAPQDHPLDILLVLDVSGSMQRWLELLASYSETALALMKPGDRIGVATFADDFKVTAEFSSGIAKAASATADATRPRERSSTNLDNAVQRAARHIGKHGRRNARKSVIFVTDNVSPRDRTRNKLERDVQKSGAVFNALLTPAPQNSKTLLSRRSSYYHADITPVVEATGGDTISAEEPGPALQEYIQRLRARYTVYYRPDGDDQTGAELTLSEEASRKYPSAQIRTGIPYK